MHRAARTLSINTSNACLVNKFNNSHSGRPYTPLPPSCRLHKIYEEKLEILGPLGYENWYDDHANPFYRHPEPEISRHRHHAKAPPTQHPFDLTESLPHHGTTIRPAPPSPAPRRPSTSDASDSDSHSDTSEAMPRDKITFSADFTGFESLDSDDSETEEMINFFGDGFHEDEDEETESDGHGLFKNAVDIASMPSPQRKQFEREKRRLSNRNRIMDRGHLMPDTTVYLPILPTMTATREPRFLTATNAASGPKPGTKVRALSPYPRSRALRTQN
ncbi:hypothetical protein BGZ68_002676 [Mortierella alpina]|nr:hypothetical protein BGZ68_002676 [Mortierella alpina]